MINGDSAVPSRSKPHLFSCFFDADRGPPCYQVGASFSSTLRSEKPQRFSDSNPGRLDCLFLPCSPRRSDTQSNDVTHELNAKFVLREDGSIVLMLHVGS